MLPQPTCDYLRSVVQLPGSIWICHGVLFTMEHQERECDVMKVTHQLIASPQVLDSSSDTGCIMETNGVCRGENKQCRV